MIITDFAFLDDMLDYTLFIYFCLTGKKIEKCHKGTGIPRPYPRPWRVGSGSINFTPGGYGYGFGSKFHYKGGFCHGRWWQRLCCCGGYLIHMWWLSSPTNSTSATATSAPVAVASFLSSGHDTVGASVGPPILLRPFREPDQQFSVGKLCRNFLCVLLNPGFVQMMTFYEAGRKSLTILGVHNVPQHRTSGLGIHRTQNLPKMGSQDLLFSAPRKAPLKCLSLFRTAPSDFNEVESFPLNFWEWGAPNAYLITVFLPTQKAQLPSRDNRNWARQGFHSSFLYTDSDATGKANLPRDRPLRDRAGPSAGHSLPSVPTNPSYSKSDEVSKKRTTDPSSIQSTCKNPMKKSDEQAKERIGQPTLKTERPFSKPDDRFLCKRGEQRYSDAKNELIFLYNSDSRSNPQNNG
ncbi:hypothetical protein M9H77_28692 [Catharanthus roseus]|uniref:Uncharacterized protein n=1 Tax=Catharanthus roseus TaxID=4058 RepID=A0ACC0AH07_CATRO|nr:hypothetical protein M9H77_28692 [Catharanthus roseus]